MKRIANVFVLLTTLTTVGNLSMPAFGLIAKKAHSSKAEVRKINSNQADMPEWLEVPVFYATNRAFAGENGKIAYSEEPNGKGLLFGVKNTVAPIPVNSSVDNRAQERMFWRKVRLKAPTQAELTEAPGPREIDSSKCFIKDRTLGRDDMVAALGDYMKDTGSREAIIFVHGCCATFDRSMQRAATIASYMQAPVVLYDWVSPKGFKKYLENETRAEQTTDDFFRFLAKVETLTDPGTISLIGHSMGAKFVDQAMVRRAAQIVETPSKPKFKEVIMSNADSDAKSFLNHGAEVTSNAQKTRLYVNRTDEVLGYSAAVHGGFFRLGAPGDLFDDLTKVDGLELVDITENNSAHEMPFWVISNMHRFGNIDSVKDFQLKQVAPGYLTLIKTGVSVEPVKQSLVGCRCD